MFRCDEAGAGVPASLAARTGKAEAAAKEYVC
jgi:hypothetical protein